jgi:UrcA family protein
MNASRLVSAVGFAVSWAAALSATDAVASPGYAPGESINVRYSSAELDRRDGVESVYGRIRKAARIVCDEVDVHNLAHRSEYLQCYNRAVEAAVATIGDARLTALHRGVVPLAIAAQPIESGMSSGKVAR